MLSNSRSVNISDKIKASGEVKLVANRDLREIELRSVARICAIEFDAVKSSGVMKRRLPV